MLLEAKGSWEMAEKAYTSLLEDNPVDQVNSLNLTEKHKKEIVVCCLFTLYDETKNL